MHHILIYQFWISVELGIRKFISFSYFTIFFSFATFNRKIKQSCERSVAILINFFLYFWIAKVPKLFLLRSRAKFSRSLIGEPCPFGFFANHKKPKSPDNLLKNPIRALFLSKNDFTTFMLAIRKDISFQARL